MKSHLHEISEINDISFQNVICKKSGNRNGKYIGAQKIILNICPQTNSK